MRKTAKKVSSALVVAKIGYRACFPLYKERDERLLD